MNVVLKNNGCANESTISSTLETTTPGVTVTQGASAYPNMVIDATGTNSTPFQVSTSNSFGCGTNIDFDLNLTFPNGSKAVSFSVPTCTGGADQTIPSSVLDANDPTQADRLGRDGLPSGCAGKAAQAVVSLEQNVSRRTTLTIMALLRPASLSRSTLRSDGAGDIESAAYLEQLRSNKLVPELPGR